MVLRFSNFSGSFEIKNGLLRYIDEKQKDVFEIPTNFVQAVRVETVNENKKEANLVIIGHFQVLKTIKTPTRIAEKSRLWIYINLHLLSTDGTLRPLEFQTEEYFHYEKNRRWKIFFSTLAILLILCGFSKSFSYTIKIEKIKMEASQYNYSDLIEEGKKLVGMNELDKGIHSLILANSIKPSPSIRKLLDDAYLKRGKKCLDANNVPLAKKNFHYVSSDNQEVKPLLVKVSEYEKKKWLSFSDLTDFVRYSFFSITYYLDGGKDPTISKEMGRTVSEFQTKLEYTRKNYPLITIWKDIVIADIY